MSVVRCLSEAAIEIRIEVTSRAVCAAAHRAKRARGLRTSSELPVNQAHKIRLVSHMCVGARTISFNQPTLTTTNKEPPN